MFFVSVVTVDGSVTLNLNLPLTWSQIILRFRGVLGLHVLVNVVGFPASTMTSAELQSALVQRERNALIRLPPSLSFCSWIRAMMLPTSELTPPVPSLKKKPRSCARACEAVVLFAQC